MINKTKSKSKKIKFLLPATWLALTLALLLCACGDATPTQGKAGNGTATVALIPGSGEINGSARAERPQGDSKGSSGPAESGKDLNGCALVTTDDVKPYFEGKFTQDNSGGDCTYTSETIPPTVLLISAEKGDAQDFQTSKKVFAGLGGAFAGATDGPFAGAGDIIGISDKIQDLPGIGDEAFWTGGFLVFRKNDNIVTLTFIANFGLKSPGLDVLKELSQKALARL